MQDKTRGKAEQIYLKVKYALEYKEEVCIMKAAEFKD